MIKSLRLNNFKSFYQDNQIRFSSGMNSIVGPNGSGKSNILDAILFVFCGKSSSLRIKLLKQLVFHGCDTCFVEVNFEGFILKRGISNKGISEYYINNQLKTQLQYTKFLQENHLSGQQFIILQGEVESIAQMKPKASSIDEIGLLEYIEQEEHFEIQKAFLEKQSAQDSYRQKQSELESSDLLIKEIYPYIDFESLVNHIFQLHIELVLQNIEIHIRALAIQQMENQISSLCDKQSLFNKLVEQQIVDINNQKNQKDQLVEKRNFISNQIDENQKEIAQINQTYNQDEFLDLQIQLNKLTNLLEKNSQNLVVFNNEIERFLTLLPQKQERVDNLKIEKNKSKEIYTRMRDELSIDAKFYMRKKKDLEQKLYPFNSEIKITKDQINVYQIELERTGKTPQSIITQLVQMRQRHDETILEEQKLEQDLKPIQVILDNMKLRKKEFEKYIQDIKNQEKECEQKLKITQQKILDFNDQQLQNNKQSEIIRKLYKAKQRNEIKMIGRLGDLGDIDVKYQDALARILPELEYLLVETSSDAFDIIEYSKTCKIGRVQIIIKDMIPQCTVSQLKYPPKSQRLFDLITCDESLKNIFYHFLRDTIFVDNISDATEINNMPSHKNKWRMVTKDTEIFDVDGSIITKQRNTGFGIKYKFNNELDPYEKDRLLNEDKEQRNRLEVIQNQLYKYEQGYKQLLEDEEKTILHYKQKVVDRDILIEQINNNITQMEVTEENLKQSHLNSQRSEELNREIYILQKKIQKLELDKGQDQIEFEEVDQKLKEIANQNVQGAKENYEQICFDLDNAENDLNKTISNLQSYQKQLTSAEQFIQDETRRQEQLSVKIQNMQNLREKISFETKEIELKNKQLQYQIESIQTEIQQVEFVIKEIQKQIKEAQMSIDDLEQEKSQISLKKSIERKQHIEYSQRKEDVNKKFKDFLTQFGDSNLAKIQELQDSIFVKKLNDSITRIRNEYYQRFQQFELPQLIEIIPKQLIMSVPNLNEYGMQFCLYVQQIVEIYQSLNKNQVVSYEILNVFLTKCIEYEERRELSQKFHQEYVEKQTIYEELYQKRRIQFSQRFDKINRKLKDIYFQLSNEGDAELRLIDSVDPFSEGIEYTVKPKNKGWRQIYKLSGGERTLASLSLMFATHFYSNQHHKIYIFDEIDASLDLQNVGKVANLLKELNSQIIIVSLRPQMFEVANSLIGVYMPQSSDKTQVVHLL